MFLRMGLRPVLVCSALLALVQAAPAQVKIAVLNMQQAVYATAEVKKADAELQVKLKPEADRAQKLQSDLQAIQQQLQASNSKLTEQQQEDLNTEGTRKQRELQRLSTELQEAADAARQDILPKCTQRMVEVLKKLAAEKGYDAIVEATVTYFSKAGMDITTDATAAYDKAYPATLPEAAVGAKPAK
jgi:outer membrane protein